MEQNGNLLITVDPVTMGGVPVFRGTRVPVETFFSYLRDNYTLEEFIDCFPIVSKKIAIEMLANAKQYTLENALKN